MRAATVAVVSRDAGGMDAGKIQCRAMRVKVRGPFHRPFGGLLRRPLLAAALLALIGCGHAPRASVAPGEALVLPEHYAHSIAALGMPGARRAFQVGHGSVVGNGDAALEWTLAPEAGPVRISPVYFERDGVPVAHWWMVSARESVHFEAAAVPRTALGDSSLMLSVLATLVRTAATAGECALTVRLRTRADGPAAVPWDAADREVYQEWWRDRFAVRNGRVVAGIDPTMMISRDAPRPGRPAESRGPGPGALVATGRVPLGPGERKV